MPARHAWPTSLDDEAALLVLSDALQDEGDPWGGLIALMARAEQRPSGGFTGPPGGEAAFALRRWRARVLGDFARFTLDGQQSLCGRIRLRWRMGFVECVRASCPRDPTRGTPADIAHLLRLLWAAPALQLVDAVVFEHFAPFEGYETILRAWLARSWPTLRRLVIGPQTKGSIGKIAFDEGTLPNLRELTLHGTGTGVRIGSLSKLRSLSLLDPSMPEPASIGPLPELREAVFTVGFMDWTALARFPRLEEVDVRGADLGVLDIDTLVARRPPTLRKLILKESTVRPAALLRLEEIVERKPGALSGLTELSISSVNDLVVWRHLQRSLSDLVDRIGGDIEDAVAIDSTKTQSRPSPHAPARHGSEGLVGRSGPRCRSGAGGRRSTAGRVPWSAAAWSRSPPSRLPATVRSAQALVQRSVTQSAKSLVFERPAAVVRPADNLAYRGVTNSATCVCRTPEQQPTSDDARQRRGPGG